jgi:hypothetical protein
MNKDLLRLLELLKIYNGGKVSALLEDEFKAFSYTGDFQIETIADLVESMEIEMSYWEE